MIAPDDRASILQDIANMIAALEAARKSYTIDIRPDMMHRFTSTDRRYIRRRARRLGVTFFTSSTRPRVYLLNLMGQSDAYRAERSAQAIREKP